MSEAFTRPLEYYLRKYDPDWQVKLRLYSTAKLRGEHVAIVRADGDRARALVRRQDGSHLICSVFELDDFVL